MKIRLIWFVLSLYLLGFVGGCVRETKIDPITGQETKYVRIDPNVVAKIEPPVQETLGILDALALLFPVLIPVNTALAGLFAMWLKLKPKLVASEEEKDNFYRGGEVLAMALEEIKTNHKDVWERIGPTIETLIKNSVPLENAIRGFRHLAPK